jgi:alcohol dehydrogenase (cytochrome c)
MRISSLLACAAFVCSFALAQTPDPGRRSFETRCARCHGGDATGGESGPNIVSQIGGRSDTDLAGFLRAGRPANGMPAFDLTAQEMAPLIAYVRTLVPISRTAAPTVVTREVRTASGETIRGQVAGEGMLDLQLKTADGSVRLLRKQGDTYRVVTSQTDWPTYHGDPSGNRYSKLTQIDKSNVSKLAAKWTFPLPNVSMIENTPLVVEGIMYVSSANECYALDAGSGRMIWHMQRARTKGIAGNAAQGFNRGVAWSGNRIFMLTDNAHMIAMNRFNGELLWETPMADWNENYNGTSAPLAVDGLVISGTAGGDEGVVRGFVAAYDQNTGKEVWRIWTVPLAGEPGSETWKGTDVTHRSGATWMTGTYDPQLDTLYWPVGNPGPDFDGNQREGDNLYTDSILALDAKTGKLKWYFQFTPHDVHDWDAQEPPVLVDTNWHGQPRKLLLQANRNGFFYVLDRTTGEFLLGKAFLKNLNWAEGIGKDGRPILKALPKQANGDTYVCPGFQGGANWYSTSFNPATGLYYFNALERCNLFTERHGEWAAGKSYMGGAARPAPGETFTKYLRAIDIQTGDIKWDLQQGSSAQTASAGVLSTASGLVFFGENSGSFMAADANEGKPLWSFMTNQTWKASPLTYEFDHKQYVAIAAGQSIMAFALPEN